MERSGTKVEPLRFMKNELDLHFIKSMLSGIMTFQAVGRWSRNFPTRWNFHHFVI